MYFQKCLVQKGICQTCIFVWLLCAAPLNNSCCTLYLKGPLPDKENLKGSSFSFSPKYAQLKTVCLCVLSFYLFHQYHQYHQHHHSSSSFLFRANRGGVVEECLAIASLLTGVTTWVATQVSFSSSISLL